MRTLKISLIATAIATAFSFWAARFNVMESVWPEHPQVAGFLFVLVICIVVQIAWPKEWLSGQRDKS